MDIKVLESAKELMSVIVSVLDTAIDEEKHIEEMAKEWKERQDVN